MRARLSGVLSIAALLLASAPAVLAAPASAEEFSIRITVVQADLDTPAALARLYGRVEDAATEICRRSSLDADGVFRSSGACRREAVARAIEGAHLAPLSAFHADMTREPVRASPVLASR
ncbi:MAG: UrcA family protein [Hyphomonadaceae bacterium]|nr:UrcA family protein [Hyphomonadaceae bacterium]